ncbi:hypothetical protein BOTNAR_0410g00030 [Botryotinia narcissicola]|uniref:GDP/GTP exchange factor Sec2 N-terminal domain-containing protein n=1 Tax=Botryotinia narcissicola TaxID=278944 RepID=A0A4Z1HLK2_9HELO|nr:hypothetical protein BOTNAR_0410g00030 [Botryotinia narcissicola]
MAQTSGIESACPNCGMALPHSMDKWADYEDEIQSLKRANYQQTTEPQRATTPTQGHTEDRLGSPSRFSYLPVQNRLSSLLSRKSTPNLQAQQPPTPPTPSTTELVAALTREQGLRQAAEGKLNESSVELEELTAQLFTQANEMVATERKARAKLEERVEILERRDGEKRKRLERLEGAVQRIERDKTTRSTDYGKGATELCAYAAESRSFESYKIIPRERTIYQPRDIFGSNNGTDIKVSIPFPTSEVPSHRATATK